MERERDRGAGVVRRPPVPGQRPDAPDEEQAAPPNVPSVPPQARPRSSAPRDAAPRDAVLGDSGAEMPDEAPEALARARTALGFTGRPALLARRVDVRVELDHEGAVRTLTRRTAWEATRDGADAFPVVALVPPPVRGRAEVEALRGCTSGPEYVDLRAGVCVRALKLREPLTVGQVSEAVHRVRWPALPAEMWASQQYWELTVDSALDEVRIEVVFHPTLPARSATVAGRTAGREWSVPLASTAGAVAWSGAVDGPGVVALRWEW